MANPPRAKPDRAEQDPELFFAPNKKKHCFCISVMNKWDFNKHGDLLQTSFFFLSSLISAAALLCCLLSFLPSAAAGRHLECCFCLWLILPVGRHTHSDATTVFNMVQSVPNLFKALRVTGFTLLCPNPFWSAERSSKNTHLLPYARFCSKIQTITVYFILIASRGRKKLFIIHINIFLFVSTSNFNTRARVNWSSSTYSIIEKQISLTVLM